VILPDITADVQALIDDSLVDMWDVIDDLTTRVEFVEGVESDDEPDTETQGDD